MENKIELTGFTDEVSSSFATQLAFASDIGLRYIEIRGVDGIGISDYTPDKIEPVCRMLQARGIGISAVGSSIGKSPIDEPFEPYWERYKSTVQIARMLHTKYIRIFSFFTAGSEPAHCRDQVLVRLARMIDYATAHNVILLHENEKGIYGDTAARCLDLMEELGCPHFKAVFDFANLVQCGEDTRTAYEMLRAHVAYIHIKDAIRGIGQVVPAGRGDGALRTLLAQFQASGYQGFLSLEPHLRPFVGLSALEPGRHATGASEENGSQQAFLCAMDALKAILWDLKWM